MLLKWPSIIVLHTIAPYCLAMYYAYCKFLCVHVGSICETLQLW